MLKRFTSYMVILAISASSTIFAQGGPSALERARERYQRSAAAQAAIRAAQGYDVPWTPFIISFTPMLSVPFGYYDTNLAAGIVGTLTRDVGGIMASSVFNIARDVGGFEGAGVFNMADRLYGAQAAGVFNTAGRMVGFQGAGVFNTASDVSGVQMAGLFNIADRLDGVQAAGLFNVAHDATGLQVGVVNIAEQMDGVQLGLVNIAKDGVTGFGGAFDPGSALAQVWWQNGTRMLYTVFSAEMPFNEVASSVENLVVGQGIGTRLGGRYNLPYLDIEVLSVEVAGPNLARLPSFFSGWDFSVFDSVKPFPELRLRLGVPIARKIALVGGLTVDTEIAGWGSFPARFRSEYVIARDWFDLSFTSYARWYVGLKF